IFESPHDYNRDMREAMYGWMTLHLKGEGDGSPIKEPEIKTENPEELRCYRGDTRPKDFVTIPKFAAAEGRKLLAAKRVPATADEWKTDSERLRTALIEKSLGGFPKPGRVVEGKAVFLNLPFFPEPGVTAQATVEPPKASPMAVPKDRLVVLITLDSWQKASDGELLKALREAWGGVVVLEPRASGRGGVERDQIGRAPDHNSAEWGLWIGRPLIGQWAFDVRRLLDLVEQKDGKLPPEVIVIGEGPAGLAALCAVATD